MNKKKGDRRVDRLYLLCSYNTLLLTLFQKFKHGKGISLAKFSIASCTKMQSIRYGLTSFRRNHMYYRNRFR